MPHRKVPYFLSRLRNASDGAMFFPFRSCITQELGPLTWQQKRGSISQAAILCTWINGFPKVCPHCHYALQRSQTQEHYCAGARSWNAQSDRLRQGCCACCAVLRRVGGACSSRRTGHAQHGRHETVMITTDECDVSVDGFCDGVADHGCWCPSLRQNTPRLLGRMWPRVEWHGKNFYNKGGRSLRRSARCFPWAGGSKSCNWSNDSLPFLLFGGSEVLERSILMHACKLRRWHWAGLGNNSLATTLQRIKLVTVFAPKTPFRPSAFLIGPWKEACFAMAFCMADLCA